MEDRSQRRGISLLGIHHRSKSGAATSGFLVSMCAGLGNIGANEVGPPVEQLGWGKDKTVGYSTLTPKGKAITCWRMKWEGAGDGPTARATRKLGREGEEVDGQSVVITMRRKNDFGPRMGGNERGGSVDAVQASQAMGPVEGKGWGGGVAEAVKVAQVGELVGKRGGEADVSRRGRGRGGGEAVKRRVGHKVEIPEENKRAGKEADGGSEGGLKEGKAIS